MKVDKAPQPRYFKGGWIEFHQPKNEDLYYIKIVWNVMLTSFHITAQDKVIDETHLKELQSFGDVKFD